MPDLAYWATDPQDVTEEQNNQARSLTQTKINHKIHFHIKYQANNQLLVLSLNSQAIPFDDTHMLSDYAQNYIQTSVQAIQSNELNNQC